MRQVIATFFLCILGSSWFYPCEAYAAIVTGDVQTEFVTNKSSRYLGTEIDSSVHSVVSIYPKLIGQPDTGIGYGHVPEGNYRINLLFQSSSPLLFLKLLMQTTTGSTHKINLLEKSRNYHSDTWYKASVPVAINLLDNERFRLRISARVAEGSGVVALKLDDIEFLHEDNGSVAKGDLSFDTMPLATRPPTALISGSSRFSRFVVEENTRWQTLPGWYEENRVQQHSRYSPSDYTVPFSDYLMKSDNPGDPDPKHRHWYWHSAEYAAAIGATVWTRHVKSRLEGPHWLTNVPATDHIAPEELLWQRLLENAPQDRNPVDDFLSLANENNLHTIAYYRMIGDTPLSQFAPYNEWFALKPNRQPIAVSVNPDNPLAVPGFRMSMFSPYPKEIVGPRILELAEKGFAGAYFDSSHGTSTGDWSNWAERSLNEKHGISLPARRDLADPAFRLLLGAHTERLVDVFTEMQQEVHAKYPEFPFIVSTHKYSDLVSLNSSAELVSRLQIPKTERKLGHRIVSSFLEREIPDLVPASDYPDADLSNEFSIALIRDTSNGRPPHVWIHNPSELDKFDENGNDLLAWELGTTTAQLMAAASSVLAMGGVANVDVYDDYDDGLLPMPANSIAPLFEMGHVVEPFLSYTRPIRTICIHVNEGARNRLFNTRLNQDGVQAVLEEHWRSLVAPAIFAFDAVKRAGFPVGFITDPQLSAHEFGDCRAIVLSSNDLSAAQYSAVSAFSQNGGLVNEVSDLDFSRLENRSIAAQALLNALQPVFSNERVRIRYAQEGGRTAGFFTSPDSDVVVAISGDVQWLTDPTLTPEERRNYVPDEIPDATVTLRGIRLDDIASVYIVGFSLESQTWVKTKISKRSLLTAADAIHVPFGPQVAPPSRYLSLLQIRFNHNAL